MACSRRLTCSPVRRTAELPEDEIRLVSAGREFTPRDAASASATASVSAARAKPFALCGVRPPFHVLMVVDEGKACPSLSPLPRYQSLPRFIVAVWCGVRLCSVTLCARRNALR